MTTFAQRWYLQSQLFQKGGGETHIKLPQHWVPLIEGMWVNKVYFSLVAKKWGKVFILNNKKLQGLDLWLGCLYSEHIVCAGLVLILEQGNYSSSKWQIQSIAISEEENIFLLKFFLLKYMYYTTLYVIIRIQLGLFSLT